MPGAPSPGITSPNAMCEDVALNHHGSTATHSVVVTSSYSKGLPVLQCNINGVNAGFIKANYSCPETYYLDETTFECIPPQPPECPIDDPFPARGDDAPILTGNDGRRYVISLPPEVCYQGCFYDDGRSVSCYAVKGSSDTGFCNYILKSNGETCGADDYRFAESGDRLNDPQTPPEPDDPTTADPEDPCGGMAGYVFSGTTCVPAGDGEGEGEGDGDDSGTGSGSGSGSGSGTGSDGDGGTGTGTGSGSIGDGDGGGGDDDSGTGSGNGSGTGNGSGDGSGEGDGQCDPSKEECGEGEDEKKVEGVACSETLKCEGDVIQCAILQKQKEQTCMYQLGQPEQAAIEAELISGDDNGIASEEIPVSGLFNEAVNKGRWLPSRCPAPERVSVMGTTVTVEWTAICRFAEALGPILVILASIFFAVYIGKAVKGS